MRRTIEPAWNMLFACALILFSALNASAYQESADPSIFIDKLDISDCISIGNKSYAQIQLEYSWENINPEESILFQIGGEQKKASLQYPIIDKHQNVVGHLPLASPQVISFDVEITGSEQNLSISTENGSFDLDFYINLPSPCHSSPCIDNSIGGRAYFEQDKSVSSGIGISNVVVTLSECENLGNVQTVKTNNLGEYAFENVSSDKEYLLVFDLVNHKELFETPSFNNRIVRTINGPSCNNDLSLTRHHALSSSQSDVEIIVPCYVHGAPKAGTRDDIEALLSVPYSGGNPRVLAKGSEVGALWGVAWDPNNQSIYSSAVIRRHSGFGPLGVSGIYKYNETSGIQSWLDASFGGIINFGNLTSNSQRSLSASRREPAEDALAWESVGRAGIGDLEISDDGKYLFLTNLAERKLMQIEIDSDNNPNTPPSIEDVFTVDIPAPCGSTGIARPWGLKYRNGVIYVSVTCDASISASSSDLRAFIYPYHLEHKHFGNSVLDFPLTYPKGSQAVHVNAFRGCGTWRPWNDDYETWCTYNGFYASPQPLVSDIEFTSDGSMTIGIIDRSAYMLGADDLLPDGSGYEAAIASAGDLLRAHQIGENYYLESGGKSLEKNGSSQNNYEGPGGGEFYDDSYYLPNGDLIHSELAIGALAFHDGLDEIVYTAVDPLPYSDLNFSGGLRWQSTNDGSFKRAMILYQGTKRPFQGKSAGLGDLELTTTKTSLFEIGDYVWLDVNKNGVQDACDEPLSDIHICLLNENGEKLSETSSDEHGRYIFSSTDVEGLKEGNKYFITFGCGESNSNGQLNSPIGQLKPTHVESNTHLNSDVNILDGQMAICLNLQSSITNYSYDAGFVEEDEIVNDDPELDLSLSKTLLNEPKKYGDTASYIIKVVNEGAIAVKNTIITDYLPSGFGFDKDSNPAWAQIEQGNLVTAIKQVLLPGEYVEIPLSLIIKEEDSNDPFAYLNIAEITYVEDEEGKNISTKDVDSTPDANPFNDILGFGANLSDLELFAIILDSEGEDDHDPEPLNLSDLSLTKEVTNDDGPYNIGEDAEYVLTVKNEGNTDVEQVVLADYPPLGMTLSINDYVGWLDNGDGSLLNVIQGPIGPGESVSIPIVLTINENARNNSDDILVNNSEIIQATDKDGNGLNDFDSEPANINLSAGFQKEDDESSASIVLLALTPVQCDSLVERRSVNISIGNNCHTEILPEYIFAQGGFIPSKSDIVRYEYQDTSGSLRVDSIIPPYFLGSCINVTAYVDGCQTPSTGSGTLIPYSAMLCLEDKDPPNITCAPSDTISCLEATQRLFTGFISDCSDVDTLLLDEDIEEIPSGPFLQRIRRTWQIRDAYGFLSDTCSQLIVVRRLDFVNQLSIPEDTTLSCDLIGGIDVPIPPSLSGQVEIEGVPLGDGTTLCNTAAFYEDQVLINTPCKKTTLRRWTINEWRDGRDSIIERGQIITVIDTVAPTVNGLPDTLRVNTSDNTCFANVDLPVISFSEVCSPSLVSVDMYTPTGAVLDQNGGIVSLPVDTNHVFYVVSDPCHNSTRDTLVVIVIDNVGPLTICQSSLSIDIPMSASEATIPAEQFDINSLDACGGDVTKLVRHMDSTVFRPNITFDCDDIGDTIMVMLQVTDELGNASTCMIRTAVNGDMTTCVNNQGLIVSTPIASTYEVGGLVFSYLGVGIPNVEIRSSEGAFAETDNYGNYFLGNHRAATGYDITAEYSTDFGVGVSTFDLLKIQRHIIGLEPLDDPYRIIAADINNDQNINALDLVLLRKYILGFDQSLSENDSWRFVSDTQENDPMGTHRIASLENNTDVDFVGIKVGDVTGDAVEAVLASSRSNNHKLVYYDIIDLGGYREVSFIASEDMSISGLQAMITYNSEILKLMNVNGAKLNLTTSDYNTNISGHLLISWASNEDKEVKKGEVLWRIMLESSSGNEWNYNIDFKPSYGYLNSEYYDDNEIINLHLERAQAPSEELSEVHNEPNPWGERTKLNFDLPRSGMVELEVYDAQNRLVINKTKIFDAGNQKWIISNRDLSQGGVYFGKMSFEGKTRVFKMIKIE